MREAGEFPCALIAFCEKWPQFSEWTSGKACCHDSNFVPGCSNIRSCYAHRNVPREIPLLAGLKSIWRQDLLPGHADPESSVTVHRVSEESCRVIVILGM
jgi:hypothetical protein